MHCVAYEAGRVIVKWVIIGKREEGVGRGKVELLESSSSAMQDGGTFAEMLL